MQDETEKRGMKRKRWQPVKQPLDVASKFSGKLHTSLREVQRAAKKAKVHETQRIVKRLKRSGTSTDKLSTDKASSEFDESLENELRALKLIDTDLIMKNALVTRVKKDGVLSKDERIIDVMQKFSSGKTSTSKSAIAPLKQDVTGRVEARIRSSKKVAEVMKSCIDSLRDLVLGKEKVPKGDPNAMDTDDDLDMDAEMNLTGEAGTGAGADDERSPYDGFSDAGWESGSIDDPHLKNDEEEEGGIDSEWESGSISSSIPEDEGDEVPARKAGQGQPAKKKTKVKTINDLPQKAPIQSIASAAIPTQAQSTFLPTLATGYIRGGSSADDQWSDDEDPIPKEKKNRRGQRARRAIWEKKYGRHANHVKKKNEEIQAKAMAKAAKARNFRSSGGVDWHRPNNPLQRPQPYPNKSPGRPAMGHASGGRGYGSSSSFRSSFGEKRPSPKKPQDEKPLHPSWEAKRKEKEKTIGIRPVKGTKIKFD